MIKNITSVNLSIIQADLLECDFGSPCAYS